MGQAKEALENWHEFAHGRASYRRQPDCLRTRILMWIEEEIRLGHLAPRSGRFSKPCSIGANCRAAPQLERVEGLGVVVNDLPYRRIWDLSPVGGLL